LGTPRDRGVGNLLGQGMRGLRGRDNNPDTELNCEINRKDLRIPTQVAYGIMGGRCERMGQRLGLD